MKKKEIYDERENKNERISKKKDSQIDFNACDGESNIFGKKIRSNSVNDGGIKRRDPNQSFELERKGGIDFKAKNKTKVVKADLF